MGKQIIEVKNAVPAVGPYNHVVKACGLYFFSGQIPLDSQTGEMVSGGIEAQTGQVLANIENLLKEIGKSKVDVVRCVIYLTDLSLFTVVNDIYASFFGTDYPSRSCVQVAALPKNALIEIETTVAD